jgi:hypothetical protein
VAEESENVEAMLAELERVALNKEAKLQAISVVRAFMQSEEAFYAMWAVYTERNESYVVYGLLSLITGMLSAMSEELALDVEVILGGLEKLLRDS